MRFLFLAAAFFLGLAGPAKAQSWFTREACEVVEPAIDQQAIDPEWMVEIEAKAAKIENGNGRLWKITGKSGAVSHLWGTFHSKQKLITYLPQTLRSIIASAKVVATEHNSESITRLELMEAAQRKLFYRAELAFKPRIDIRLQQRITDRLSALGYRESILDQISPAGLISIIASHPCEDFYSNIFPIQDYRILLLARDAGAELVGLEDRNNVSLTVNANLQIAEGLIDYFGAPLDAENLQARLRTTFALYLSGRISTLLIWERQSQKEFFGDAADSHIWPAVQGYLLDERNFGFVKTTLPLLERGDALLAMGAFHLPGPNGMVTLLRRAGYTVERVPVEGEAQ